MDELDVPLSTGGFKSSIYTRALTMLSECERSICNITALLSPVFRIRSYSQVAVNAALFVSRESPAAAYTRAQS